MKVRLSAIALLFVAAAALAQESTKISALAYGDYYWVASHHDPSLEERNGFWFRRIYLTVDQTLTEKLSGRLRFEMNQAGDFRQNLTLEPFVKDAWLKWRRNENMDVIVGLSPTPTWDTIEQFWGYRSIEKTPLDLQRMGAARDFGVALLGKTGPAHKIRYHLMAGNGANTGSETNAGKQVGLLVGFNPTPPLTLEVYADRDDRPGRTDRTTYQAFAGWQQKAYRVGLQLARQHRDAANGNDIDLDVASAFLVYNVRPNLAAVFRVDRMFDPNPEGDRIPYLPFATNADSTLAIAGVDFKLHKRLGVIPNVEWVKYGSATAGATPEDDLIARATFYYTF